jgi:hypothetical protein
MCSRVEALMERRVRRVESVEGSEGGTHRAKAEFMVRGMDG